MGILLLAATAIEYAQAPTLAWSSGGLDNTPQMQATYPDVLPPDTDLETQFATDASFTTDLFTVEHTLSAGEAAVLTMDQELPDVLFDDTWYARHRYYSTTNSVWSAWSNTVTKTIETVPTLTAPTATRTASTTADLGATTDQTGGTFYWVVTNSTTPPSAAQIKAGLDHTGSAASASGSQAVAASGAQVVNATGLPTATSYAYYMHEDQAANQSNVVAATVYADFQIETTAWVNAVTAAGGTVSANRATAIDTFISAMKSESLWATLDRYWLLAGEDAPSARIDLKGLQSHTVVGAPTFTASQGYAAASNANYVNSGFVPASDGVNFTLNSATFGGQINTDRTVGANAIEFGCANAAFTNVCDFFGNSASNSAAGIINATGAFSAASTTSKGSWIITRTSSNATRVVKNGASFNTDTDVSTGLPDTPFAIGALRQGSSITSFTTDQIASFFVAAGWSLAQAQAFETAQNALMTSIGINVY